MPIVTAQGAVMPGPFPGGVGGGLHANIVSVINQLTYGVLWGGAGTLVNTPGARLDLQGYTAAGQMNLQVQINNVGPPSTVSTVLVANTAVAVLPPSPRSIPQQLEITRKIKSALFDSFNDYLNANPHIWLVNGAPSS